MELPLNGRIVIVDDNIIEATPLIKMLSKLRIPYNYYSGTDPSELPDNAVNKLRILFLDLNIFELNKDEKTVISALHPILLSIIPDNPNPYLLVIWSKKNNIYSDALSTHFSTVLPNKRPAETIFLSKTNYFDYKDGSWIPQIDCIEKITFDLNNGINHISFLKHLIRWENLVHSKTAETIGEFSSFYPINNTWNEKMKKIVYRLGKAVIGNDDIRDTSNENIVAKAFININTFLFDKLETELENKIIGTIEDLPNRDEDSQLDSIVQAKINSTLHIFHNQIPVNKFDRGNIYFIPDTNNIIHRIIWPKIFSPPNQAKCDELRESNPLLIQLDITPACDYSQDKNYVRLVHGLLIMHQHSSYFKGEYYYKSPKLYIADHEVNLIIDFRYVTTELKQSIIDRGIAPTFILRREICTDIQSRFSNHVNRPGISNL